MKPLRAGATLLAALLAAWTASAGEPMVWDDCGPESGLAAPDPAVPPVPLLTPQELRQRIEAGKPVLMVDVRTPEQYNEQHLAGARSIPLDKLAEEKLPSKTEFILYCAHCCCPEVPRAARVLRERGFGDIAVLRAGLEEIGQLVLWQRSSKPAVPERLIELGCGEARREIKELLDDVRREKVPPVAFEFRRAVLLPESKTLLESVAKILGRHPGLELEVRGHTCDIGTEDENQRLSDRRSEVVRRYLMGLGVAGRRVRALGFGESDPVVPNLSEEARVRNRRVEFRWLEEGAEATE